LDFEKLGSFYLGKEYDLKKNQLLDRLVMYDARDLTTHAFCVGMTGSGKTGLCISLLEEAAIDHVPAIIIDPKGDVTNLLLTFPDLRPEDFRRWINVDDARRKNLSEDEFASQQAEMWRKGLEQWSQDGARIRMLRESTDFVIYTPGSETGVPVSILQSFAAPALNWDNDAELLRERIQGTVSALLGLVGVDADPVRSREHILMANLFEYFWRKKEDLDLLKLILAIQNPPIRQLGAFDIDTFFPHKERFQLAMNLNNIIAAPSFQSWLNGQPLDIPGFLGAPNGKPRHSIFYIAHLSDPERMFFVTMLLNQVITWMRAQPGTTSLRALLYMDEIFGFFPPVANPPSKQPMLTLLKQARAFGLGVVLTTQNPVDLDYKGLTNTGTWFIGRLQTERDKMRVLDGLENASLVAGQALPRDTFSRIISSLANRVFLLHNVHDESPIVFQTRWAMSYLRGPLARSQVQELMSERRPEVQTASLIVKPEVFSTSEQALSMYPPGIPSEISQVYIPKTKSDDEAVSMIEKREARRLEVQIRSLVYQPAILAMGKVNFTDPRRNVNEHESYALLIQLPFETKTISWEQAVPLELKQEQLVDRVESEARFSNLPAYFNQMQFNSVKNDLVDHLYRTSSIKLLYSPILNLYSEPRENERDFQLRIKQLAREQRDAEVDKLNERYARRLQRIDNQLRRLNQSIARKQAEAQARKGEVLVSAGESVLGMLLGRRSIRTASTTLSKYRQSRSASMTVEQQRENLRNLQREMEELKRELEDQASAISERWEAAATKFDTVPVKPSRNDIEIDLFALAWAPHWNITYLDSAGTTRRVALPAY
jgi:hypothetical protein